MDDRLDRDQGVTAELGDAHGRRAAAPRSPRGGGSRRSSSATRACALARCSRRRSPGSWSSTSARCACSSSSPRSGSSNPFTGEIVHDPRWRTSSGSSRSRSTARRLADDHDGRHGHGRRRRSSRSRSPTTWHGSRRRGRGNLLVVAVLMPALGELPRQGLRLADHSRRGGRAQLGCSSRSASQVRGYSTVGHVARVHVSLAAVHDPARSTRGSSGSRARCSRRRRISGRARSRRSAG